MFRWTFGGTKRNRIRNERIRGTTKLGEISTRVQERRLKWYGYVMRMGEEYVGKIVMMMDVEGRRKGRPKRRWMDRVNVNLREKGLPSEETQNQQVWGQLVRNIEPLHRSGKRCGGRISYPPIVLSWSCSRT